MEVDNNKIRIVINFDKVWIKVVADIYLKN